MYELADLVVILPPFGDAEEPFVVVQVQHVTSSGEIVNEPDVARQYILGDGIAYAPQWLEHPA
jgi:hypothetical protein